MVKSGSTSEEESSPFFQENRQICLLWDKAIREYGGQNSASVTAWALNLRGRLSELIEIELTKATYSNGNLLISGNKNIFKQTILTIGGVDCYPQSFTIKKRSWYNLSLKPSIGRIANSRYYLSLRDKSDEVLLIINLVDAFILRGSLKIVHFDSPSQRLIIDIRELVDDTQAIERLLKFVLELTK